MGALLDYLTVVHDDDEVGMADGGEAVCNDDAGASGHELVKGLLYQEFVFGVEGAGGFVEYEDGGIFENGAGYAESLPLSSAEFHAAVADIGLVGLFHAVDKFVGVGYDSGLFYMVEAVVGSAKGDVVGNGIVEEDAVLRNETYLSTDAIDVEVADGDAVDEYLSVGAVVETGKEVDESGFAGARGAYNGNGFAFRNGEVDAFKHVDGVAVGVGLVGERYVAVFDGVVEAGEDNGIGFLADGFVGFEYFVDAGGGGVGFLKIVVYADNGLHGGNEAGEEDDKKDEDRREQLALLYCEAAQNEDEHQAQGEEYLGQGAAELAAVCHADHAAGVVVVGFGEAEGVFLLLAERFDGADSGEGLFEQPEEMSQFGLPFGRVAAQADTDDADEPNGDGEDEQEIEEEAGADKEQGGAEDYDVEGVFAERDDGGEHAPFDVGEVVGHAADDVATTSGVEVGYGEDGDFLVDVVAKAHGDAVAHGADEVLGEIAAEVGKEGTGHVGQGNGQEAAPHTIACFVVEKGIGHGKREVVLAEGERGQLGGRLA